MRITAQAKEATRRRLLDVAEARLAARGLADMNTGEVATAAGVAHGTLFNYFATKEALGLAVCHARLVGLQVGADGSLEEELFRFVADVMRRLEPFRASVGSLFAVVDTLAEDDGALPVAGQLRDVMLEPVRGRIAARLGEVAAAGPSLHLFWALTVGVLGWWSTDSSPHQEDTLVLLDRSTRMFVALLVSESGAMESHHES